MKIIYFANVKEIIGKDFETLKIDKPIKISEVVKILTNKTKKHHTAFTKISNINCSLNHKFSDFEQIVFDDDELAFFPPVTGG